MSKSDLSISSLSIHFNPIVSELYQPLKTSTYADLKISILGFVLEFFTYVLFCVRVIAALEVQKFFQSRFSILLEVPVESEVFFNILYASLLFVRIF